MSQASTRRAFVKGAALVAAPLATTASAAAAADDQRGARLARLEDEAAIRELHQAWLRRVNTGAGADPRPTGLDETVRAIAPDHAGPPDSIEFAADGQRAAGRFHCAVEIETALAQDCTLAQMAHAQGGGVIRRTERRVLKAGYVKAAGAWAIVKLELAPHQKSSPLGGSPPEGREGGS